MWFDGADRRRNLWTVAALWLFLYFSFALLAPPLLDDADSVHAEVAREMLLRRDPVTLYANGIRYLEKAPVLYWSMAASMKVFGVGTVSARIPLAVYALLLFLLTERFGSRAFNNRTGLYGSLILLLSFGLFIFTRILIPDAIVCLWLTASVYCFWRTEFGQQEYTGRAPLLPCLGFAAACALNILTKGLIGLVFPLGTVLVYLLVTRGVRGALRRIGQFHIVGSTLLFFAIAAPWHILAGRANPTEGHPAGLTHTGPAWLFWKGWQVGTPAVGSVHGWTWFYFMNEHLLRYLNLRVPRDYDTVPLYLFWGLLLVWLMPWSGFLFSAVAQAPWRAVMRRRMALDAEEKTLLLLAIAALLPICFFSFSTRQEYYVLPSLPFFALLIGRWLDREATEAETMAVPAPMVQWGQRVSTVLLLLGAVASCVCVFFLLHTHEPTANVDLAVLLRQNPGDYALSFGHFLDLNAAAMGMFRQPLTLTAVALFSSTLACWWLRRNFRPAEANVALAAGALAFLVAAHQGLVIFAPVLTSRQLADGIKPMLRPKNILIINDEYEAGSTLGFYLWRNDIHILHGHSANLWYGSFFTDAPHIFETDESLREKWTGPERVFLWTDPAKLPQLPTKPFLVVEGGGKEIVSNRDTGY